MQVIFTRDRETLPNKNQIKAEDVRYRVLRLLQDNPASSQRDIAKSVGISLGGVNYCLNALVEKGHIKMRNFQEANDKRKYVYLLTPKGIAEKTALTGRFLQRKMREYEALKAEIEDVRAEMEFGPEEEAAP
ncbi:MAG: EPS-associated MarR family transcriptional regulator [Paracoccaceae bacterium]